MAMMSRGYVYAHVCWCDRAGQIGESGSLRREGFMGPGKPSSPVTTWLNRSRPASRWFSGGRMSHLDEGRVGRSLRAKTSSREQSLDFDLVGTSRMVVVRETCGATRMTCWSGSSPAGCTPNRITTTLSDMSDCLSIEVISLYRWHGLEDDDYGYVIMIITMLLYSRHQLFC
jgi:hypothetical protein